MNLNGDLLDGDANPKNANRSLVISRKLELKTRGMERRKAVRETFDEISKRQCECRPDRTNP